MEGLRFDWALFGIDFLKIAIAFALTLPIAWEREHQTRIMGLRTFPLVAVATCGYMLVAISAFEDRDSQARAVQGLMSGIGFIGGGAILKEGATVRGTATAASVWSTGALGAAVAFSQFEVALLLSAVNFLTLRFLTPIEEATGKRDGRREGEEGE
jgi:putative Mg2+ transporter-C (MgtC) family protein